MTDTNPVWDRVRGMVAVSFCDWPGKVSCVLFTSGCNLRCPTCHNASLAWKWQNLPALPRETILTDLKKRRRWLDGITLSGGEPTILQGLDVLLGDLKATGLPVKLDSNGSAPDVLERVLREDLADSIAVDVKGPWSMYPELTGGKMTERTAKICLERIFGLALSHPGRIYFRCTKVPALSIEDLEETRGQVPEELPLTYQEFVPPRSVEDECENYQPESRSECSCPSRL